MGDCCDRAGYEEQFGDRFARRIARRYRRRGLNPTQERLVGFLTDRGIQDAAVLEIGGGIGEVQVALLQRGARQVTNLEISTGYEEEAARLLTQAGLSDRVERRILDIAQAPEAVEPADVVVLHRVVCCYADFPNLLAAAGSHARRMLVFSHPPDTWLSRASFAFDNALRRLRGNDFRAFVHPPKAMVGVLEGQGLRPTYHHRGLAWEVVGLER